MCLRYIQEKNKAKCVSASYILSFVYTNCICHSSVWVAIARFVSVARVHVVELEVASKHCTLVGFAHYTSAGFVVIH